MEVSNRLTNNGSQPKFSRMIQTEDMQKLIRNTLGSEDRVRRYVTAISSSVSVNKDLQKCTAHSVLCSSLVGEALNLSPSPQLGHYYLVPYENRKAGVFEATFQLGYKGYIQLAIRSGQYRSLNVVPVLQGEISIVNPLFEQYDYHPITDFGKRASLPTVGYVAAFELVNGYRKVLYWTKEQMLHHADKYSKAFSLNGTRSKVSYQDFLDGKYPREDRWKYSSFWYTNFDAMACKTMLRQLISKWGIMSVDMQQAYTHDEGVAREDGSVDFVDAISVSDTSQELTEAPESRDNIKVDDSTGEVLQEPQAAQGGAQEPPTEEDLPDGFF